MNAKNQKLVCKTVKQRIAVCDLLKSVGYKFFRPEWEKTYTQVDDFNCWPIVELRNGVEINFLGASHDTYKTYPDINLTELVLKGIPAAPIEISLNDEYKALVFQDRIEVGCQTFSFETLNNLVRAVAEQKKKI